MYPEPQTLLQESCTTHTKPLHVFSNQREPARIHTNCPPRFETPFAIVIRASHLTATMAAIVRTSYCCHLRTINQRVFERVRVLLRGMISPPLFFSFFLNYLPPVELPSVVLRFQRTNPFPLLAS